MDRMSKEQGLYLRGAEKVGSRMVVRAVAVSVFVWALLGSIFLLDILTPPDNISVCFAYAIPIFVSLFELRPRPILYAAISTALSLIGSFIQPPSEVSTIVFAANRLIAVVTQWLAAALVGLQQGRLADAHDKAEFQQRFVNILSHEVGTALTAVAGHAYRIAKLSDHLSPSDLRLRAEKIRKAAERIELIIDRVQFASSLGDGTIPIRRDETDVQVVIKQLMEQLGDDRRAAIVLNLHPEPQVVHGDGILLRQMFENIIVNSIKYSPENAPISMSVAKRDAAIRITIADSGGGIPLNELSRVRIPYYRGGNSKGTDGAGLGLYLVERIVDAHQGRLLIESEIGKGTKVIVELPSVEAATS